MKQKTTENILHKESILLCNTFGLIIYMYVSILGSDIKLISYCGSWSKSLKAIALNHSAILLTRVRCELSDSLPGLLKISGESTGWMPQKALKIEISIIPRLSVQISVSEDMVIIRMLLNALVMLCA